MPIVLRSGRTAFALQELLVILALLAVAAACTLAVAAQSKEISNRVICQRNLTRIAQALIHYADDNKGLFPCARYNQATADKPTAYTNPAPQLTAAETAAKVSPTFAAAGPGPNDVTAALFLLIPTTDIHPGYFLCPSVRGDAAILEPLDKPREINFITVKQKPPAWDPATRPNFTGIQELSYSYANPYPNFAARQFKMVQPLDPGFAVLADTNPGVPELLLLHDDVPADVQMRGNSKNHGGQGENVLFADGHVDFESTPFVGENQDNIYTFGLCTHNKGGDGIIGSPAPPDNRTGFIDSVLLPTEDMSPAAK